MNIKRPKVLLIGNGISRAYSESALGWEKLLEEITENKKVIGHRTDMPFGLEAVLRTNENVKGKMSTIQDRLYREVRGADYINTLNNLLSIKFDEILTTNYDLDIEAVSRGVGKISGSLHKGITHNLKKGKTAERKYFIHTAQHLGELQDKYATRLWHIHGHVRNADSMVLGHYYYGRLLAKYVDHFENVRNRYEKMIKGEVEYSYSSWIDAFVLGDVYILGFGFDYAEIDMWWLLNRKWQEKEGGRGKTVYYEPKTTDDVNFKKELLRVYGVDVDTEFGIQVTEKDENVKITKYAEYYERAIQDIRARVVGDS